MTPHQSGEPLDRIRCLLAVVAHPDDESFAPGAVPADAVTLGAWAAVVCFIPWRVVHAGRRPG
jgi:LmbE family N-acetylglucosaminyl deacetylase